MFSINHNKDRKNWFRWFFIVFYCGGWVVMGLWENLLQSNRKAKYCTLLSMCDRRAIINQIKAQTLLTKYINITALAVFTWKQINKEFEIKSVICIMSSGRKRLCSGPCTGTSTKGKKGKRFYMAAKSNFGWRLGLVQAMYDKYQCCIWCTVWCLMSCYQITKEEIPFVDKNCLVVPSNSFL